MTGLSRMCILVHHVTRCVVDMAAVITQLALVMTDMQEMNAIFGQQEIL